MKNSHLGVSEDACTWVDLELDPLPESITTPFGQDIPLVTANGAKAQNLLVEIVGVRTVQVIWRPPFHSNPYIDWLVRSHVLDDLRSRLSPTHLPSIRRWIKTLKCTSRDPEEVASDIFAWAEQFNPRTHANDDYLGLLWARRVYDWGLAEGLPGFDEHSSQLLMEMTPNYPSRDYLVSMRDVVEGPFTRAELHLIESELRLAPGVTKRQMAAFHLARDWGLRPVQLALITVGDIGEDALGPFVLVCSVKGQLRSKLRRWNSNKVKRYVGDDTYEVLKNYVPEAEETASRLRAFLREAIGDDAESLETPLFPTRWATERRILRMACDPKLREYALHAVANNIGSEVIALTHILKIPSPRAKLLGDPDQILKISCQRLRRTKGTSMVISGNSIEDVAEALDHSNTTSVKHYFRYNRDIHDLINQACTTSPEIKVAVRMWEGRIESRENSSATAFVGALGGCTLGSVCPHHPTVSCYACSSFKPWRDADHKRSLESITSLSEKLAKASSGPVAHQLDVAAYGARALIIALNQGIAE